MKVKELIKELLKIPQNTDVCVYDSENAMTTSDIKVHVTSVYGSECAVIEPVNEEDDDGDDGQ